MDIGQAAGILEQYIRLALGRRITPDMDEELVHAVSAFQDAARSLAAKPTAVIPADGRP